MDKDENGVTPDPPERKLIRNFGLRMPEELAQRIEQEAGRHHRSMHSQILYVLDQWFPEVLPDTMIELPADVPMIGPPVSLRENLLIPPARSKGKA